MFCKECGKQIDNDSKFCSFCGIKQSTIQVSENVEAKVDKYDRTYEGDSGATIAGIFALTTGTILSLIIRYSYDPSIINIISTILFLIWWIIAIFWVINIAKRQNRNATAWGIFAFLLPFLATIIMGLLKKLNKQSFNQNNSGKHQNVIADQTIIDTKKDEIDLSKNVTFEEKVQSEWTSFWGKEQIETKIEFSDGNIGTIFYVAKDGKNEKYFIKLKGWKIYYRSKEAAIKALHFALSTNEILRGDDYLYMK